VKKRGKVKILLIAPGQDENYAKRHGFAFKFPPLALATVAALVKPGIEVRILDEHVEEINYSEGADLVGISAMTAVAPRAYRIADKFRSRGTKVVLGGVHPSVLPQEAIQHADALVMGEAEVSWPRLIEDFEKGRMEKFYSNKEVPSLSGLPEPRRDLYKKKAYFVKNTFQTTRGCPYDCSFCSVSGVFGKQYRSKPVEDVIRSVGDSKSGFVGFIDDNIAGNKRYSKDLFKALAPLKVRWAGQSSVNAAEDPELLDLLKKSGCVGLFMGFETISQGSMGEIGKHQNKIEEFKENVKKMHDHGIVVLGAFVFGFDSDDKDVFKRTLDFVFDSKLDLVQFSILTPLPGTAVFKKLSSEGRIIDTDWSKYDMTRTVFKPALMTADELQKGSMWAWREFYSTGPILKRMTRMDFHFMSSIPYWIVLAIMNFGFKGTLAFNDALNRKFIKEGSERAIR